MIFDLTVRPTDWLLGLWWTEFASGIGMPFPDGAHRMVHVRNLPVINAASGPEVWIIEVALRPAGGPWEVRQRFESMPRREMERQVDAEQKLFNAAPGCQGGRVAVHGDASEAARMFGFPGALPVWLNVLIIEHKAGGVAEMP